MFKKIVILTCVFPAFFSYAHSISQDNISEKNVNLTRYRTSAIKDLLISQNTAYEQIKVNKNNNSSHINPSEIYGQIYAIKPGGSKNNPTSFSYKEANSNGQIYIRGDINRDFYTKFKAFLDRHPKTKTILINSGGGKIDSALMAGQLIRERNLNTQLTGNCISSCVLVFLGGVNRTIPNSNYKLGFHRVYTKGSNDQREDLDFNEDNYGDIVEYLAQMLSYDGTTVSYILDKMTNTPSNAVYKPTSSELSNYCVATSIKNYQTRCNSQR